MTRPRYGCEPQHGPHQRGERPQHEATAIILIRKVQEEKYRRSYRAGSKESLRPESNGTSFDCALLGGTDHREPVVRSAGFPE